MGVNLQRMETAACAGPVRCFFCLCKAYQSKLVAFLCNCHIGNENIFRCINLYCISDLEFCKYFVNDFLLHARDLVMREQVVEP